MGNVKLRTKATKKACKVACLGPGAVNRPHTFEAKVSDGSERVCKACRRMQDAARTPPMLLKCVRMDPWE